MKSNVLIAAALLAMTGCTQPTSPAATVSTAAQPADASACASAGYQVFPAGITLPIQYHLRADRIYADKTGTMHRRVMMEFLEGDAAGALAAIDPSLVAAGYAARARPGPVPPNGNIVTPYVKKGSPNVIVIVNANPGETPASPLAKGTISVDYPWPVEEVAAPTT